MAWWDCCCDIVYLVFSKPFKTNQKKTPQKTKQKKEKKERKCFVAVVVFFPEEQRVVIFFLIHFLLQTSAQGLMHRKRFTGCLWRGLVWEEQEAEHRAQGIWFSLGSPAQHRARPGCTPREEPEDGQPMPSMENCPSEGHTEQVMPVLAREPPRAAIPGQLTTLPTALGGPSPSFTPSSHHKTAPWPP